MKILHLTLKKKWFNLIASGKKTVEYREFKPYWEKRLVAKRFTEVHFRNGYGTDDPFMRVACIGIFMFLPKHGMRFAPKHGEKIESWHFAIVLGEVLEVKLNK